MQNNVEEAYCSFEVSKLLKEKGFNCLCNTHYSYGSGDRNKGLNPQNLVYVGGFINKYGDSRAYRNSELVKWELPFGEFTRPTHALAIEWLRVNFNIWIHVDLSAKPDNYIGLIVFKNHLTKKIGDFDSPQEATEAALLYVLKELI